MIMFLFFLGLFVHFTFVGVLVVHAMWKKRFWPPPTKGSWQIHYVWWSIRVLVVCIIAVAIYTWGNIDAPKSIRLFVALPFFLVSLALGTVGFVQLGWRNTHGEADKFVSSGLYKFSRNPQYVLYSVSFISLGVLSASWQALILLLLLSFWYLVAPFAEESWLEEQYGAKYLNYKQNVPRYIGWPKNT